MDKRIEVRCSEGELEAWKAAAGRVPLSRWLRDVVNVAVATPVGFVPDSDGMVVARVAVDRTLSDGSKVFPGDRGYEGASQHVERSARPDFKGGKR
jgi:hypothetical protein